MSLSTECAAAFLSLRYRSIKNINEAKYNQPRSPPGTEIRLFGLTMFYWGLKHEHVSEFNERGRLLSHELLMRFEKILVVLSRITTLMACFISMT